MNKTYIWGGVALLAIIILFVISKPYTFLFKNAEEPAPVTDTPVVTEPAPVVENPEPEPAVTERPAQEVIGSSAGGNPIVAYTYGTGDKELLLITGVHGGYSWNTALLGFQLADYLDQIKADLKDVRVTVIPVLNPDGLKVVTGKTGSFLPANVNPSASVQTDGRFNANKVDLNRNFDCEWQATGKWQDKEVSGGNKAFSEPEAMAIKNYIAKYTPDLAVVYYSSAGGVYASTCKNGILPMTNELLATYGKASGYKQYAEFDYYEITGDMVNWMAGQGIPAISVLLTGKTDTELTKNKAGLDAVIEMLRD